jgi:S1-C subfamily serine protease
MEGLGSGFVYDKAGHVLTNNHVIEGATAVQVHPACEATLLVVMAVPR